MIKKRIGEHTHSGHASNTKGAITSFIGCTIKGYIFNEMDGRFCHVLIFDCGWGLAFNSSNGSYWIESPKEVARMVAVSKERLEATQKELQNILFLAGEREHEYNYRRRWGMNQSVSLDRCEREVRAGLGQGLMGALRIGKALEIVDENNLWLTVGAKSFDSYASNTFGLSRSTCYNFRNLARYFSANILADPSLQTIESTRLIKLIPHITEHNKEELLHSAAQIPDARGFDNFVRSLQKKTPTDECDHPDGFDPVGYEVCRHCNLKRKKAEG